MRRVYCDLCGAELRGSENRVSNRIKRALYDREHFRSLMIEVIAGVGQTWNAGDLCEDCVVRVVKEGTDIR